MADYYPLIARAVAGLEKNTGDTRRALYDRARAALVAQLRSVAPALSESDVTRERLALEEAVRKVEAESVRQNRGEARIDSKNRVKPPEMPRWETPAVKPRPAEGPPPPPPPRRPAPSPVKADTLNRVPAAARADNAPAAAPKTRAGEQPDSASGAQVSEPISPPPPVAARPQGAPLRERPSGERQSLLDSVNNYRNIVSEPDDLRETAPRPAKSARRDDAEAAPVRDFDSFPPRRSGRFNLEEAFQDAPVPEMLEPSVGMDEPRAVPNRARPPQFLEDETHGTEAHGPRSYRDLIRVAVPIAIVAAMAGVLGWQWPNITGLYHSLRAPAPPTMEVAGTETPAPISRTKINDRYEPGAASQSQKNVALTPSALPGPAVAQRVVLYEETPGNPQGRRFVGSAIWRTETITPGSKQAPELAIRADVEIPERQLAMTWSLRRNTDPSLPASHTIEIMFKLPNDFEFGGVSNVPGIMMKQAEEERGAPLAGLAVKVTNGFFLIGLSSVEADKDRNIALLKDRAWFDIPVLYSNNRRAILALEKGTPGERAFAEAFAAWQQ